MESTKDVDTIDKDNYGERKRLYKNNRKEYDKLNKEFSKLKREVETKFKNNEKKIKKLGNKVSKGHRIGSTIVFSCLVLICLLIISYISQMSLYQDKLNSAIEEANKEYQHKAAQIIIKQNNMLASIIKEEQNSPTTSIVVEKDNSDIVNTYIANLDRYPNVSLKKDTTVGGQSYYVYTDIIELTNYYVSDSGTDTIFPGAIIKGESLFQNNVYTLVPANRTTINLTSNHSDGYLIEVDSPNYSTVSDALRVFQADINEQNAKEWTYDSKLISSTKELNATLGVNSLNIGMNIGISNSQENTTVAIIFKQIYNTVVANPKQNSADYFQEGTNLGCLGCYEPAYISSVDYGRMIIVLVTSNMSEDKLSAEVGACFNGVGINVGMEKLKTINDVSISYAFYGGKTDDISLAIGNEGQEEGLIGKITTFFAGEDKETAVDRINEFIDSNSDLVNPVPISYKLKYLSDNSVVPTMSINRQEVFTAENVKMVTINFEKSPKKNYEIRFPDGTMRIDDNSFLWDERVPFLLEGTYNDYAFSVFVDAYESGKLSYSILRNFFWDTELILYISEVKEQ